METVLKDVLFTSLYTADLSDDLDGPLMFLDMALYLYLSTVAAELYGSLQTTLGKYYN